MRSLTGFFTKFAAAVVAGHIGLGVGLFVYNKSKRSPAGESKERNKLLSWVTRVNGVPLVKEIAQAAKDLHKLQLSSNDILIVSYPKSGTTWVQELVFNILNDLDFVKACNAPLDERVPFLEWLYPGVDSINRMPSPRILKTHLPIQFLPRSILSSKCKIIYVLRNPRDVCVSYYHFVKMIEPIDYQGEFREFFQMFCSGEVAYGRWIEHVDGYVTLPNVYILSYEDMCREPVAEALKLAEFLNAPLSQDQAVTLARHCSFTNMRANPSTNYQWLENYNFKKAGFHFHRKGEVGDWINYFSPAMVHVLDRDIDGAVSAKLLHRIISYEPGNKDS